MGPALGDAMHFEDNIPKLSDDGSNWVDYHDRMLWLLESQSIDDHIDSDSTTTSYTTLGKVGRLDPADRWRKEEMTIKQVIGPSIPCAVFSRIKRQKNVKGVWTLLKQIYEEKAGALATDLMQRFWNMRCSENDNVHTHFKNLHSLQEQLASMGKLVSDKDYTHQLAHAGQLLLEAVQVLKICFSSVQTPFMFFCPLMQENVAQGMLGPMTCLMVISSFLQRSARSSPPTLPSAVYEVVGESLSMSMWSLIL